MTILGLQGLFTYLILIHPSGDSLAAISMANWVVSILVSLTLLILGITLITKSSKKNRDRLNP